MRWVKLVGCKSHLSKTQKHRQVAGHRSLGRCYGSLQGFGS